MDASLSRSAFENELRTALTHLYDPAVLRDSLLVNRFALHTRADATVALRRILVEAIESLRPSDEVPPQSNAWRYYQILYGRYTEQFTQIEVSNDLGLSVRHLRRLEQAALQVLADRLWTRFELIEGELVRAVPEADANTAPPSMALGREEELTWSQTAFPNESVEVDALIQSALQTAEPMLRSSKLQVAYEASQGLPRLAIQLVPLRQALLNILTTATGLAAAGAACHPCRESAGRRAYTCLHCRRWRALVSGS